MYLENRFKMLTKSHPEQAKELLQQAQQDVNTRWKLYQYLAAGQLDIPNGRKSDSSTKDVVSSTSY